MKLLISRIHWDIIQKPLIPILLFRLERMRLLTTIFVLLLVASLTASAQELASERMTELWEQLKNEPPKSTAAILDLATRPEEAIRFLDEKLIPLTLDEQTANELISQLSDDSGTARTSFEKLQYLDPRLALSLDDIIEKYDDPTILARLAEIFSDYEFGKLDGQIVELERFEYQGESHYNFVSERGSWSANPNLGLIGTAGFGNRQWIRLMRCVALLDHLDSPASTRLLKRLASGNAETAVTKLARDVLLTKKRKVAK